MKGRIQMQRVILVLGLVFTVLVMTACAVDTQRRQSINPDAEQSDVMVSAETYADIDVTLPITQPLASLVTIDAGIITTTQIVSGTGVTETVELPVQGAFMLPDWSANNHHRAPLAVILPDAYRTCEANLTEEWPCPTELQGNDYLGMRYLTQALALRGYDVAIVNLNGAYSPVLASAEQDQRAVLIVNRLLTWMADDMREPRAETYGGEMSMTTDYDHLVFVGHGRGADVALAVTEARMGENSEVAGMQLPVGLLLVAPGASAETTLPDIATSIVVAGCINAQPAYMMPSESDGERTTLLATVSLPNATRAGFNAFVPDGGSKCGDAAMSPEQQQAWLALYAPDFADTATGYAPPYVAAGLDALAPLPDAIYGLPIESTLTDPGRPGQAGEILPFNLGEFVVEQPAPSPADRMPLRTEGVFIVPQGDGPHPLVVLLHLRGANCFSADVPGSVWPCGSAGIPRYDMGYDYLLQALAERGYAVAVPNLVGAFTDAPDWAPTDGSWAANAMDYFRVEPLVDQMMAELAAANRGESLAFGLDLTDKLALDQLLFMGHSRGGEWANMLVQRRADNVDPALVAAGMGPVSGLFFLTPAYGDFLDVDSADSISADVPFVVVPAYCDADLREYPLLGQTYFEQALVDETRQSAAWVAALKTGEHYAYNTQIDNPAYNPSAIFCQNRDDFLPVDDARAFVAQLVPDFFDVALRSAPIDSIPGFDPVAPLPDMLYGVPIEISAQTLPELTQQLLAPVGVESLTTNALGGANSVAGNATLSFCQGTDDEMCIFDETVELRPEASHADWVYAQPKWSGYPPQVRVQWDAPDARFSLTIPEGSGRFSLLDTLHFRVLVDMFDERNAAVAAQAFSVALVDAAGNEAVVMVSAENPALIKDSGTPSTISFWSDYPLRARSVRIPLGDFSGVDLSQVRELAFVFDQTAQGSILFSDVESVSSGR